MTGSTSGTWLIDKNDIPGGFTNFVVTMKDGNPIQNDFLWFLIDTSAGANACSTDEIDAGWDLCGTWSMYGQDGNIKNVSHMDLFVGGQEDDIPPFQIPVPEPSAPLLLGIGLLGLWLTRRRSIG